jgi:uncharacterized protein involved in outer membrane biogenesis
MGTPPCAAYPAAMTLHWRRAAAVVAGGAGAYALAGFLGVPWLLQSQLPRLAHAQLGRPAALDHVRFNPFTLRLQAQGLRLAEADGTPLLSLGELRLRLQWRSLLQRAWSFEEVHLGAPRVHLVIAPDGQLNFARLLAALPRQSGPSDAALPRLRVERFALAQGRVDLDDRQAGHAAVLAPIAFEVERFSTLPDDRDKHVFTAQWSTGGRLRWQGEASLNPIRASGEVTLENFDLSAYQPYLKPFTRLVLAEGRLAATLPYRVSYVGGRLEARVEGARLALDRLAVARAPGAGALAALDTVRVEGIAADLVRRQVAVAAVRLQGGHVDVQRDASGELELAQLALPAPASTPARAVVQPSPAPAPWSLSVSEVELAGLAVRATDASVQPPVTLAVERTGLRFGLQAAQTPQALQLQLADASLALEGLALTQAQRTPLKLGRLGFSEGSLDLAARRIALGRINADDGQLQLVRAADGALDLLALLPRAGAASAASAAATAPTADDPAPAWSALARRVELARWTVEAEDRASGIRLRLHDVAAGLEDVGSDPARPVAFRAGLRLAEGGQLAVRGQVVPASGRVEASLQATQLALRPLQPLLARHVRLDIAGGSVSTQGRLKVGAAAGAAAPSVRYDGAFEVAGLALNENDGKPFLGWKSVAAEKFSVGVAPGLLEIPELRVVEPKAVLILEDDRSFNAARLLVQPPAPAAPVQAVSAPAPGAAQEDGFAVRVPRVRLQNAHLDFEDRSLRPQFGAVIHELNGVVTGLSSQRDARSQIELDGRVGEFGLARVRGGLDPFGPRDNTDIGVIFRNVDLVPVSPYAMKFAGYRIAGGKVSLDLRYKVRNSRLEGENKILLDKLVLGERVESPDALNVPLELAIAILQDSDGRIDLGLPVSGDMNDPQFSYGGIIWKAIGTLLAKVVTAPFRALGAMLGVSGEQLEAIEFDPGSSRLLPPEREKLRHVGEILAKRAQLQVTVPGGYHDGADGAALRAAAVRAEIARRAGIPLAAGEAPGPLDLGDRAVREALRGVFAARFGNAALEQARKDAEAAPAPNGSASGPLPATLPAWQRAIKFVQGEPQVADARAFYRGLRQRLEQAQPLPADALAQLGVQRAQAVAAALAEAGADPGRVTSGAPAALSGPVAKLVPLKLELGTQR